MALPYNIPLLDPVVLRRYVEKLVESPADGTILTAKTPRISYPESHTVTWDIIQGSRTVGKPNFPGAEASIVPQLGRDQGRASMVFYSEKKVFSPMTLRWLRAPGELGRQRAEESLKREIKDLNKRLDNLIEVALWKALSGTLNFATIDANYPVVVDYQCSNTHKPTPSVKWDAVTDPIDIMTDIQAYKRLITEDSGRTANQAYLNEFTLQAIFKAFASNATTGSAASLLSDSMKENFYKTGTLPGFMGMNWTIVNNTYNPDDSNPNGPATTYYVPNGTVILGDFDDETLALYEGVHDDFDAPEGYTGRFQKTFRLPDPSVEQHLLKYNFIPVVQAPEAIVYLANVLT